MVIKYIITTVYSEYKQALDNLLLSMHHSNIPHNDITLSVQNLKISYTKIQTEYSNIFNTDISSVHVPQLIYEYSFFITAMEMLNAGLATTEDWFFLLHDTALMNCNHQKYVNNILKTHQSKYDIIFGDHTGRHNIGLYNYKSIIIGYKIWKKYKYLDKHLAINIEHNNLSQIDSNKYSFKSNPKLKIYYPQIGWEDTGDKQIQVYDSDILRNASRISFFDIDKYFIFVNPGQKHPNTI